MKKIFSFAMLFAAAATAFVACSKEEVIDTPNGPVLSGITKTITVISAVTRTTIEDKQLQWAEGDYYGILFADAAGKIIGNATSPKYSAETEIYSLEVPEETAALYCYYPYDAVSRSEVDNAVAAGATGVKYGIVDLNIYDGELSGDQYTYMAANAAIEDDTVSVKFQLLASILELNIYDSANFDDSALTSVTISADKAAGWATLSFADGDVNLLTAESEELNTYIRASFNSYNGIYVYAGTEAEPLKVYVPILKGNYENLDIIIATDDHSFGSKDNRIVINKNEVNIEKDLYTVKIDLAEGFTPDTGGDEETGVGHDFENAEINKSAGVGDANATINSFEAINWGHPGYSMTWGGSANYIHALDITGSANATSDMAVIQLDKWPTNLTQAFGDSAGKTYSDTGFAAGTVTVYGYGESWLCFYDPEYDPDMEYPIAYLYINFHSGKEETVSEMFVLAAESQKPGIQVRPTVESDDWYVSPSLLSGAEQWTLIVTTDDRTIYFDKFPDWSDEPLVSTWEDTDFVIAGDNKKEGNPATVTLSDATDYNVFFYDSGVTYVRLHVVVDKNYDLGDEGDDNGNEKPATPAFVIDESHTSATATIKQAAGNEDWAEFISEWNGYGEDLKEYWELTVTGETDTVAFSSCPKWSYEEDDYNPQFLYSNGSSWAFNYANAKGYWTGVWNETTTYANILGDSNEDPSADYIMVFFEIEKTSAGTFPVPTYALHVVYNK